MQTTRAQVVEKFEAIRAALPACIPRARVTFSEEHADRGGLQVLFDGATVGTWVHTDKGWLQFEGDAQLVHAAAEKVLAQ